MFKFKIGKRGFSLVENLMGVLLLGILITGILGVYYVSAGSISRGAHMAAANSALRSYIARELAAGYKGGEGTIDVPGSYYVTMPMSTGGSAVVLLGDVTYTITCDPWYPSNIYADAGPLQFDGIDYKVAGFKVSWIDKTLIGRQDATLSVKSAVIICKHDEL